MGCLLFGGGGARETSASVQDTHSLCPQGRTASSAAAVDPSASSWHTGHSNVAFDVRETFSGFPFAEAEDVAARTRACSSSLLRAVPGSALATRRAAGPPRARRGRRRTAPPSPGAPTVHHRRAEALGHGIGQAPERDFVVASRPDARRRHRQFVARVELVPLVRLQNARVSELAPHQLQALDARCPPRTDFGKRFWKRTSPEESEAPSPPSSAPSGRRRRPRAPRARARRAHVLVRRLPAEHGVLVRGQARLREAVVAGHGRLSAACTARKRRVVTSRVRGLRVEGKVALFAAAQNARAAPAGGDRPPVSRRR